MGWEKLLWPILLDRGGVVPAAGDLINDSPDSSILVIDAGQNFSVRFNMIQLRSR